MLSGNSASYGGGIYNDEYGTIQLCSSTLLNNSASDRYSGGGGIFNSKGTLTIANSTFVDNSAICTIGSVGGGAIYNFDGILAITNSTLTGNSADIGGGIYSYSSSSAVMLNNTIVAENNAFNLNSPDIYHADGTLSGSHNLIGNGDGQPLQNGIDGNQVGAYSSPIDPMLSNLTQFENGQWGCYLLSGSSAVDAGDDALAIDPSGQPLIKDLRGNARIIGDAIDIGAMEGSAPSTPAQTYLVTSLDETIASDGTLTFLEALLAANGNLPVGDAPAGSLFEQDTIQFANTLTGTILVDDGQLKTL